MLKEEMMRKRRAKMLALRAAKSNVASPINYDTQQQSTKSSERATFNFDQL